MLPLHGKDNEFKQGVGKSLKRKVSSWIRAIFSDPTSRNLFAFLTLNLSFAIVELLYGIWTNSLGLISDSFHMFFDCTALLAGLAASVVSRWRSNEHFSYGFVRAEVLAGFINGLFLLFIAFFIFSEAVERIVEVPEVHHERLMVVSIMGFIVNLVGIFVFQHGGAGHGHSHGGLGGDDCTEPSQPVNSSQNQILKGVFLHILADTLGSVGVIISAFLMQQFGWMIADPICSMIIATLIGMSVIPLIRDSVSILMQRTPYDLDHQLPACYQRVMGLEGVYSVHEPHFWTLCSDVYIGTVKVEVSPEADAKYILSATHNIFTQVGVRQLYVQIDRAEM
ncbi:hypothetical protein Bbelb_121540 [Branchiostoma belcheri]|nr:hypothetical protein Bbelb_121540 [Branchiostoma belcheri]